MKYKTYNEGAKALEGVTDFRQAIPISVGKWLSIKNNGEKALGGDGWNKGSWCGFCIIAKNIEQEFDTDEKKKYKCQNLKKAICPYSKKYIEYCYDSSTMDCDTMLESFADPELLADIDKVNVIIHGKDKKEDNKVEDEPKIPTIGVVDRTLSYDVAFKLEEWDEHEIELKTSDDYFILGIISTKDGIVIRRATSAHCIKYIKTDIDDGNRIVIDEND